MSDTLSLPRTAKAQEVAEALGLPLHRVYALTRENRIPHVRIGRQVRYPVAKLVAWIEAGGTAAPETD